jgi:hypothetical protein
MNDPFTTNAVIPSWQFPGEPGVCQGNLETGDPVEGLAPDLVTFPVTIGGVTYHPQNEALLQWFAQVSPSNALDGAYSYPNESSLTAPSLSCPWDCPLTQLGCTVPVYHRLTASLSNFRRGGFHFWAVASFASLASSDIPLFTIPKGVLSYAVNLCC